MLRVRQLLLLLLLAACGGGGGRPCPLACSACSRDLRVRVWHGVGCRQGAQEELRDLRRRGAPHDAVLEEYIANLTQAYDGITGDRSAPARTSTQAHHTAAAAPQARPEVPQWRPYRSGAGSSGAPLDASMRSSVAPDGGFPSFVLAPVEDWASPTKPARGQSRRPAAAAQPPLRIRGAVNRTITHSLNHSVVRTSRVNDLANDSITQGTQVPSPQPRVLMARSAAGAGGSRTSSGRRSATTSAAGVAEPAGVTHASSRRRTASSGAGARRSSCATDAASDAGSTRRGRTRSRSHSSTRRGDGSAADTSATGGAGPAAGTALRRRRAAAGDGSHAHSQRSTHTHSKPSRDGGHRKSRSGSRRRHAHYQQATVASSMHAHPGRATGGHSQAPHSSAHARAHARA